ncbi:RND transporter, partial [Rhodococcus sp. 14C212]|nr:RND transporter [Rhodococcus sp. 14C212]
HPQQAPSQQAPSQQAPSQQAPSQPSREEPAQVPRAQDQRSSPPATPPLPRRQRGDVPPPVTQAYVRPQVQPQPRSSGAPIRDPQAIENWLSQLRRANPRTADQPVAGDRPSTTPPPEHRGPTGRVDDSPANRPETDEQDSQRGRHGGAENSQSISVSELIARQRRR